VGIPIAVIKSGAARLDEKIELISLEVHRELNKIPEAKLTLLDGSVAKREFAVSNSEFFALGSPISIALGDGNKGDDAAIIVFEGLVVRHAVETGGEGGSMLRVELKDAAFKLTRQRKSAVFPDQTDDQAIAEIVRLAGGLTSDVEVGKITHTELVQYYASDWDFIVSRADVQGLLVDVHCGKVSVKPMALGAIQRKLDYGLDDTTDLSLEIDGSQQWSEVSGVGWDLAKHALAEPELGKDPAIVVGNLDASAIAEKLGGKQYTLFHPATHAVKELETWASARLLRSRLALLRGRAVVDGDAALAPLQTVEILGVGARFNGKALISGITHKLDHDGWTTELQLGLPPEWFARQPDITEVSAGGLLPAVRGLQIATVAGYEADPLGEHRIKVLLPALDKDKGMVWARMARPDAGKDRGFVFWPEPEDEVVVGFLDGDPRQAIVLGALHGKPSLVPDYAPTDTNDIRVLLSRAGSMIGFNDKTKALVLSTPAGNTVQLSDDAKGILITDQHGNSITMNDKGITIESGSDFTIDAAGKVVIKGSAVDVQ
jgi:Rhs element Vgr protein